jgi:hypothetical protein
MKGRKHREAGGVNEAKEDVDTKPEARTNAKKIDDEAEEKSKGGRAGKATGGRTAKAFGGKMVGKVAGEKAKMHAGRKPRKNGGRTGSDGSPFTSARHGTNPPGRKEMDLSEP